MSDLQRSFAKSKLAGLPSIPPEPFFEEEEEEEETDGLTDLPVDHPDDDSSSASSASSTGTIKPTFQKKLFARPIGCVCYISCYIHVLSLTPPEHPIRNRWIKSHGPRTSSASSTFPFFMAPPP
jgi:hypothetical protein